MPKAPDSRQPHSDPGLDAVLSQITQRQAESAKGLADLNPEQILFSLMRTVPRQHWNTPRPRIDPGLYQRGLRDPGFAAAYPFNMWAARAPEVDPSTDDPPVVWYAPGERRPPGQPPMTAPIRLPFE